MSMAVQVTEIGPWYGSAEPAAMTRRVRVLLANEHPLQNAALAALLGADPALDVVATVTTGDELVCACIRHRPTVAVVDAALPGQDPIVTADAVGRARPGTRVLLLSAGEHRIDLQRALRAGVAGYLGKDATADALLDAVRRVAGGHRVVDPGAVLDAVSGPTGVAAPTASELRLLRLVADGLTNKEIALALRLSHGTVRNYVSSLMAKTNGRNRVDIIRIARERGWI